MEREYLVEQPRRKQHHLAGFQREVSSLQRVVLDQMVIARILEHARLLMRILEMQDARLGLVDIVLPGTDAIHARP